MAFERTKRVGSVIKQRYDPVKQQKQWTSIKRGAHAAGGGFVGLAKRAYEGVRPRSISPIKFVLFLVIAILAHITIELRTNHIFTPERIFIHAIIAFILVPILLEIRIRDGHFEELFSAYLFALFIPVILGGISQGLSGEG